MYNEVSTLAIGVANMEKVNQKLAEAKAARAKLFEAIVEFNLAAVDLQDTLEDSIVFEDAERSANRLQSFATNNVMDNIDSQFAAIDLMVELASSGKVVRSN
jgi:hypothetical protein